MIGRGDLNERVREWGLREDVVEKDYVIGWALWGIGSHPSLSTSWAFKGGTGSIRSIAPRLANLGNNNRHHQPVMGRRAVVIARLAFHAATVQNGFSVMPISYIAVCLNWATSG